MSTRYSVPKYLLFIYHKLKFVYDLKCYWFSVWCFGYVLKDSEGSRKKTVGISGVHHHIGKYIYKYIYNTSNITRVREASHSQHRFCIVTLLRKM